MRLRTQLALALFLLSVVPLLGVTVYTYQSSLRAYRRAVIAEAEALAADMSARAETVEDELSMRIQRRRRKPRRTATTDRPCSPATCKTSLVVARSSTVGTPSSGKAKSLMR